MNTRLRALRIENGLTQKQLADNLNISDKNIWTYEKGIATPPYDILSAYADFFGVTTDYLIGRTDDFAKLATAPINDAYTIEERQLIAKYRELNPHCKKLINNTIDTLVTTSTAANEQKKKG